jgi:hypothetical protein
MIANAEQVRIGEGFEQHQKTHGNRLFLAARRIE